MVVVHMGLLVYVVETLVGVFPVPAPFRIKSAEVLNVPVSPSFACTWTVWTKLARRLEWLGQKDFAVEDFVEEETGFRPVPVLTWQS